MLINTRELSFTTLSTLVLSAVVAPGAVAQCEEAKLTASDAAPGDDFGHAVSVSGVTALVGAWDDDHVAEQAGSAYVFVRNGTSWAEQAKLTASDAQAADRFGWSVSVSGDTALVGAWRDEDGGDDSGSAYVFVRSGTSWVEQAKLTASDAAENDRFGYSLAVSGDTALVGAWGDDVPGFEAGAAYVFVRSGTSWTEQAKLTPDEESGDRFGWSVSVLGDTALVGAVFDDDPGLINAGSAFVFVRNGTSWSEQARLTASDAEPSDSFGWSVSLSGDTALVGMEGVTLLDTTSAYVFVRSGTTWSEQARLTASDEAAGDLFGRAVSVSGDVALVGAELNDDAGPGSGSAYVFVRNGTSWSERTKLTASDAAQFEAFGRSVSVAGDIALTGAPAENAGGASGSAYVFDLTPPAIGSSYCMTSPNSVGPGMLISSTGALSLAKECVTLEADGGPDDKFGLFFFGPNQLAGTPFGEGLRCVGGTTQRIQPPAATGPANGNPAGTATRTLDFSLPYGAALTAAPPSTNFQYWYRDPMGGPAGFNTSDALEIAFTP